MQINHIEISKDNSTQKVLLQKTAFFVALSMFLSIIEFAIPKPLPFIRLGLANISIVISLFVLPIKYNFLLVLLKVFIQGIISGTLLSYVFLFSFVGSFSSLLLMLLFKNLFTKHISCIGLSLIGSLANNSAQIILSYLLIFKTSTKYICPIILVIGLFSGLFIGIFTEYFMINSKWFFQIKSDKTEKTFSDVSTYSELTRKSSKNIFLSILSNFILLVTIVFFSLLTPSGKLLFTLGFLKITQTALLIGLKRALILIGSMYLSKLLIPSKPVFHGKLGYFINIVLIYFKKLSTFKIKKSTHNSINTLLKITNNLDSHFLDVYQDN